MKLLIFNQIKKEQENPTLFVKMYEKYITNNQMVTQFIRRQEMQHYFNLVFVNFHKHHTLAQPVTVVSCFGFGSI